MDSDTASEEKIPRAHHLRAAAGPGIRIELTPAAAGWRYLGFSAARLEHGQSMELEAAGVELALVPLAGRLEVEAGGERFRLARESVFTELPHILYAPPGTRLRLEADGDAEFAWGTAPAEGRLPLRLFRPEEMKREVRGGGPATRQVNHVLAPPLPAERLILFEVYVPGGAWSGWPPHCHDGRHGSSYLEETYHYRIEPGSAFGLHRNYTLEGDLDEVFTVRDGDLVLVPGGFHPVAAGPGARMYFLNFLAGELQLEERATPPVDDPRWAWMKDEMDAETLPLPVPLAEGSAG